MTGLRRMGASVAAALRSVARRLEGAPRGKQARQRKRPRPPVPAPEPMATGMPGRNRIIDALYGYHCEFDAEGLLRTFVDSQAQPTPGLVTNFLGLKLDPAIMPSILGPVAGTVEPVPAPGNWHADIAEWAAALRSVQEARETYRIIELGCGWGCWISNMGLVARRRGLKVDLVGIEGDAYHLGNARKTLHLNGFSEADYRLVHGVAAPRHGVALFPLNTIPGENWGAEPLFYPDERTIRERTGAGTHFELPCVPLHDLSGGRMVDLLHIDIQGAELDFVLSNYDDIARFVRRILIGTHTRHLEGALTDLFLSRGWRQEMDRPVIVQLDKGRPLTLIDGVIAFVNPELNPGPLFRGRKNRPAVLSATRLDHADMNQPSSPAVSSDPDQIRILSFPHGRPELHLAETDRADRVEGEDLVSQLCRYATLDTPRFRDWVARLGLTFSPHRKLWELAYICQALQERGMLRHGQRGLGFAVGNETLPSYFASRGCRIVASDLDAEDDRHDAWASTGQWAGTLAQLNRYGLCPDQLFQQRVSYRPVDMNAIPDDLEGFDFTWSTCSFEHCGSIDLGLAFLERQMACLRPGGVAVHTTEFNLSSNTDTVETGGTVIFRLRDIEDICARLALQGHRVEPIDIHPGSGPVEQFVDEPPYYTVNQEVGGPIKHMRLRLAGYVSTSIGLIITKGD